MRRSLRFEARSLLAGLRCLAAALPRPGPAFGLVFEDEGVEEVFGGLFLVGPELPDGVELEAEVIVGPAVPLVESETPYTPEGTCKASA